MRISELKDWIEDQLNEATKTANTLPSDTSISPEKRIRDIHYWSGYEQAMANVKKYISVKGFEESGVLKSKGELDETIGRQSGGATDNQSSS